ncbi:MAG: hypothetical protein HY554_12580 [Elusimicrobia bacterium]|nr:hypothetical protein [Elusimicrobiota bacterium]
MAPNARWIAALTLALAASSAGIFAAKAAGAAEDEAAGFTNTAIEERKARLDERLKKQKEDAEKEFQESQALHSRLKDERLALEATLVAEKKAFLDSLKGKPPREAKSALRDFDRKQDRRRRSLRDEQRRKREEFRKAHQAKRPRRGKERGRGEPKREGAKLAP